MKEKTTRTPGEVIRVKIRLDQIEARLQSIIEGGTARLFSAGSPVPDLGSRLVAAMKENLHPQFEGLIWAPNLYTLVVNQSQAEPIQSDRALIDELAQLIWRTGTEAGLQFASYPIIKLRVDSSVWRSDVQVITQYHMDDAVQTSRLDDDQGSAPESYHTSAFFIVNGTEIFQLNQGVINIGRSPENHLVLEDPRVSRYHAQLRAVKGKFVIFDLDSSAGIYVNGQRVTQRALLPGDVVMLAGIPLIFGQDTGPISTETQEYRPG